MRRDPGAVLRIEPRARPHPPTPRGPALLQTASHARSAAELPRQVIVGPASEVAATFKGWPGLADPPWLFYESWEEAADGMARLYSELLEQKARAALLARQEAVVAWWRGAERFWRSEIASALR